MALFRAGCCAVAGGLLVLLFGSVGCSKADVDALVDKTKQAVSENTSQAAESAKQSLQQVTDKAKEQLQLAGKISLTCGQPVETSACYARLIPLGGGRPNVLQLQSYQRADQESFPAVYLHAQTTATALEQLVGQTIPATAYVQSSNDGVIWYCDDQTTIDLKINSYQDGMLVGEISAGKLINTGDGKATALTGIFEGVVQ